MVLAVIAACEVGFWVILGAGLVAPTASPGGPPPWMPPKGGWERARCEWREWFKGLAGWAVACGLLVGGIILVDDPGRTEQSNAWIWRLTVALAVWLIAFPLWATLFPARPKG